ncbi:hypothetical protein D3C71_1218580 [compost metagenome]
MIHRHPIDDRHIKVILNKAMRHMRSQLWMPKDWGNGARTEAFVSNLVVRCGTDGEGGNHLQAEGRSVVVVNQHHDIGLLLLNPLLAVLVPLEYGLPIGF